MRSAARRFFLHELHILLPQGGKPAAAHRDDVPCGERDFIVADMADIEIIDEKTLVRL